MAGELWNIPQWERRRTGGSPPICHWNRIHSTSLVSCLWRVRLWRFWKRHAGTHKENVDGFWLKIALQDGWILELKAVDWFSITARLWRWYNKTIHFPPGCNTPIIFIYQYSPLCLIPHIIHRDNDEPSSFPYSNNSIVYKTPLASHSIKTVHILWDREAMTSVWSLKVFIHWSRLLAEKVLAPFPLLTNKRCLKASGFHWFTGLAVEKIEEWKTRMKTIYAPYCKSIFYSLSLSLSPETTTCPASN